MNNGVLIMIKVVKVGGAVLATKKKRHLIYQAIKTSVENGDKIVLVNSAFGNTTDELIKSLPSDYTAEYYDQVITEGEREAQKTIVEELSSLVVNIKLLTVKNINFRTTGAYGSARPKSLDVEVILDALKKSDVVSISGFYGLSENDNGSFASFGRGGTDTSAVVFAIFLKADCYFIKEAEGITAFDPKHHKDAKVLSRITYQDSMELSKYGYRFLELLSLNLAKKFGVILVVCGVDGFLDGTSKRSIISSNGASDENDLCDFPPFLAMAVKDNVGICNIDEIKSVPGTAFGVYEDFGNNFTDSLQVGNLKRAFISINGNNQEIKYGFSRLSKTETKGELIENLVRITLLITNTSDYSDYVKRVSRVLFQNGINIISKNTSGENIHIFFSMKDKKQAVVALAKEFNLLEKGDG